MTKKLVFQVLTLGILIWLSSFMGYLFVNMLQSPGHEVWLSEPKEPVLILEILLAVAITAWGILQFVFLLRRARHLSGRENNR